MYVKSIFRFLFGEEEEEESGVVHEPFRETMLIEARNEVGECVILEVPAPIRSDLHPKLVSRVGRNLTFLRYDTERGRT